MSNPFGPRLIDFIRKIGTSPETGHIRLIGVCFGHQIIALAMGGECVPGKNGWEAGVYRNQFVGEGRYWWTGEVEGQGGSDCVVSLSQIWAEYRLTRSTLNRW